MSTMTENETTNENTTDTDGPLPQTYETADQNTDRVNEIVGNMKALVSDPEKGWAQAQKARKAFCDAYAKLVFQLRSECRKAHRTADGMVILADWLGQSDQYREALKPVVEMLKKVSTTPVDPDADGGIDSDYTALQAAINYRVRAMVEAKHPGDHAFLKASATRPGRKTKPENATVTLPASFVELAEGDDAEAVFKPVRIEKETREAGIAKAAQAALKAAQTFATLVAALAESGETISADEKAQAMAFGRQTVSVLLNREDPENPGGYVGAMTRLQSIPVEVAQEVAA